LKNQSNIRRNVGYSPDRLCRKESKQVLIAEDVYYPGESEPKEYYMSILLDRSKSQPVIMASTEGGMNIEEVAELILRKL